MIGDHYEDWELLAFDDANGEFVDSGAVAIHLLSCSECHTHLDEIRNLVLLLRDADVHIRTNARLRKPDPQRIKEAQELVRRRELESHVADQTFAGLLSIPLEQWVTHLNDRPLLRTEALIERIVSEARTEYDRRARHALELLRIAGDIAGALTDHLARAQQSGTIAKERANALRMLSRYSEALDELDRAERFMNRLPIRAFDIALIEWGRATVLFYMTRYVDALPFALNAAKTLRQFGDIPRARQVELLQAGILFEMGDAAGALAINEYLTAYFISLGDTETVARVIANMAACEAVLDHAEQAHAYAYRAMALFDEVGKPTERIRVESTIGNLFMRQGRYAEASARLTAAAAAFRERGMDAEAGQALLDVLEMNVIRGSWDEAIPLAKQLAAMFISSGAPVHAARASDYLRRAIEARQASVELVAYVRGYIDAADDALEFVPPV
ncbi:MAG TPA: hypothetical protein VHW00_22180 [Thermoanaerobaculia bacterium]|nr:hypothetical protein [Thermoanaerobaculia bacterium]